ncbi:XRE family transcriptional regulator [Streptococcus salivarius]
MHVLSDEYQYELAQGVVSIVENAIKARSKYDNKQLGIITAQQVMDELEVSYNTLKRWEEAGLKRYQPPVEDSRKVYYRISDILAFLGVEKNGKA